MEEGQRATRDKVGGLNSGGTSNHITYELYEVARGGVGEW